MSSVLKHYHDQGENEEDLPLVRWACLMCLYQIQEKFSEFLQNFPSRMMSFFLRLFIFPLGKHFTKPDDQLTHKAAQLLAARLKHAID